MGPTASGKTDLAMRLSDEFNGEIISVDSALVYRSMDIGTAKPTVNELAQYPHHLVNIRDPAETYSASNFRHDALSLMQDITNRGKIPILVGGTMMYFQRLLKGMSQLPEADPDIRADIEATAKNKGWLFVHNELAKVDPVSGGRIHPNDTQRIQRALEIYRITGKSMTEHRLIEEKQSVNLPYEFLQIALSPIERSILHKRIAERFEIMLSNGFEDEVSMLYKRSDLHLALPSMRTVGYRQMWLYMDGSYGYQEMKEKAIIATRQLAKRQFTWLKSWQNVNWIYTGTDDSFSM